ncbi:lipoprotein insertase outer membrane protein LolB [Shewanella colwelliana]|uniref:Outer-membrane lipoprotein LolB n=1 Tax=Shewanella colwelliana TaxID=23 RepID=A0ABQ4P8T0_SHECO|nr:lipoprotein insertase outer membrane protein LolB [Shewanella colwelliana]GIU43947.1 outer-membrane lipoprotein LolB [Shewanella colwelliana]
MNNLNYFTKMAVTLVGFTLLTLTGCANRVPINLSATDVTHVNQASAWEMQGKLAVRTSDDKFSTNLYWLHTQASNELRLTTMLGTTVMSLTSDSTGSTLELDGKTYHDADAERLLKRLTGWSIPVATLPLWITGQISPSDELLSQDEQLRPISARSTNSPSPWQVTFNSWQVQSGAQLPRLLQLSRDDVRLKIQINQWQALAPTPNNAG